MKKLFLIAILFLTIPSIVSAKVLNPRCPLPPKGQQKIGLLFDFIPDEVNLGNYIAPNLVLIDPRYTIEEAPRCLTKNTYNAFLNLSTAMKNDIGQDIFIRSAWRSFKTQQLTAISSPELAATAGRSEHQLGTAIDFSHVNTQEREDVFSNTAQYQWMLKHAHEFGFVQTYQEWNAVQAPWEPWHYRYVGVSVAKDIFETNDDVAGYIHRIAESKI